MKKLIGILLIALVVVTSNAYSQVLTPEDNGVYERIHHPERRVVPYDYLRQADVFWVKRVWRQIDYREKMNQIFYYPVKPTNQRKNLMTILYNGVTKESTITPYSAFDDDFKIQLTVAEVQEKLNRSDTTQISSALPPYNLIDTVINVPFDPATVKQLKVKEDWVFDKERSVMEPRIIGICPVREKYDIETYEFKGYEEIFWLWFPQVRKVIANEEVYNRYNFGQRLTYDDIFMKRKFHSLIYKVDNVFDRQIASYLKGIDALLRAKEVKNMIFTFETDVWHQ